MSVAVAATDDALNRGVDDDYYGDGAYETTVGETGGAPNYDSAGGGSGASFAGPPVYPNDGQLGDDYIDGAMLRRSEGWLYRKGGKESGFLGSRSWVRRFARLEGTDLLFFVQPTDKQPKSVFALDESTTIAPGDANRVHKNKNVKFDLDLSNSNGESISVYADTEAEAEEWMFTLSYIVQKLHAATVASSAVDSGGGGMGGLAPSDAGGVAPGFDDYDGAGGNSGGGGAYWDQGDEQQQQQQAFGSDGGFFSASGGVGNESPSALAAAMASPEELLRLRDAAQVHTAYGPGLYEGVRGEPTHFYITANDETTGGPRNVGGDAFGVTLETDDLAFQLAPLDNGDGTYYVEYRPTRAGEYTLHVLYAGQDIYGSPFHPVVSRAATAASHTLVAGDGTTTVAPGTPASFTLTTRDQFDDLRGIGGDAFEVTIVGPGLANPILDNGDGTYTVSFDVDVDSPAFTTYLEAVRATGGGRGVAPLVLDVHVVLNNDGYPYPRPVPGSPFHPRITLPSTGEWGVDPAAGLGAGSGAAAAPAAGSATAAAPSDAQSGAAAAAADAKRAGTIDAAADAAAAAANAAAIADIEARERAVAERLASLEAMRASLEADRAAVDAQMARMAELGRRVKADSERLAEQARMLRGAAAARDADDTATVTTAAGGGRTHGQAPLPRGWAAQQRLSAAAAACCLRRTWREATPRLPLAVAPRPTTGARPPRRPLAAPPHRRLARLRLSCLSLPSWPSSTSTRRRRGRCGTRTVAATRRRAVLMRAPSSRSSVTSTSRRRS